VRGRDDGEDDAARSETQIEGEIDRTRAEMSQTIDAIQERLAPERVTTEVTDQVERVAEQIKQQVRESAHELAENAKGAIHDATIGRVETMIADARETVNDMREGFMDRVRANPVPAAIAGLGLAWLLMSGDSGRQRRGRYERGRYSYQPGPTGYGYPPGYRPGYSGAYGAGEMPERSGGVASQVGDIADNARERVGDLASGMGEVVDDAREQVGAVTSAARDRVGEMMGESPLALGAIALGLGAAIGLAVPSAQYEREMMGSARDQLMERARGVVAEAGEAAREQTRETMSSEQGMPRG
jgi:hypothetical protein